MPQIMTYIRQGDWDKYVKIAKKKGDWAEFIHNALNPVVSITPDGKAELLSSSYEKPIKTPKKKDYEKALVEDGADPGFARKFAERITKEPLGAGGTALFPKHSIIPPSSKNPSPSKGLLKATGLCPHGADPKFCKHAKPGKICK